MASGKRPSAFEIFVNQQAAEIEALRTILKGLLLRSTDANLVADLQRTTDPSAGQV
jgi:hypothetical protein